MTLLTLFSDSDMALDRNLVLVAILIGLIGVGFVIVLLIHIRECSCKHLCKHFKVVWQSHSSTFNIEYQQDHPPSDTQKDNRGSFLYRTEIREYREKMHNRFSMKRNEKNKSQRSKNFHT